MNWISVKDKLPEVDGLYLICYKFRSGGKQSLEVLHYYAALPEPHFQHEGFRGLTVTHWILARTTEGGLTMGKTFITFGRLVDMLATVGFMVLRHFDAASTEEVAK